MVEMSENSLVSIIVPIYNGEQFIDKCMNSILTQTYQNIEIICVVNGTTDGSKKMIENYQMMDKRIVLIETEIGDLGRANNIALNIAKGEWITFIDIDDWVTEDYVAVLLSGVNRGYKLCKSNLIFYDGDKNPVGYKELEDREVAIHGASWLMPQRVGGMYHKSLFNKFRYLENSYYEDLAAWPVLIGLAEKIFFVNKPIYYYNQTNSSSIMSIQDDRHLVIDKVFQFIFDNITESLPKEINLLITALFIQSFWSSNIKIVPSNEAGQDYIRRVKKVVDNRLIGYHFMVDRLMFPEGIKKIMLNFYDSK